MPQVVLNTNCIFQADPGLSILDAARRSNISLPFSCKVGRCGACKCRVSSGLTVALGQEIGLTGEEAKSGWVLSCVRRAETDVSIEAEDLSSFNLPIPKTWPCRIAELRRFAPDVIRVLLRLPPAADFCFIPGQYIDVIGPNGIRRSYSLANADFSDRLLELHIKAVSGGVMSEYWFDRAKANDLLRLNGPLGTFFLRETANIDLVFLATGTGIAPVKAMLESISWLSLDLRPKTVSVLWGARTPKDLYLNLADIPGSHEYFPVASRPSEDWSGARGYVQDVFLAENPDLTNTAVYACGSDAMIQSARSLLVKVGLSEKRFYSDAFVSSGAE